VREALYAALGIQCVYHSAIKQVTIRAALTNSTPGIVAALLADSRTNGDISTEPANPFDDLNAAAITGWMSNSCGLSGVGDDI
jgi:hypothetical protein